MSNPANFDNCRLQTDSGIPYKRISGPRVKANRDGATASERYMVRGTDMEAFFAESLPPPQLIGDLVVMGRRRRMPGSPAFVTQEVEFEPISSDRPGDPFRSDPNAIADTYEEFYYVDISYSTSDEGDDNEKDENDPSTFLKHSVAIAGQFLTVEGVNVCYRDVDITGSIGPGGQAYQTLQKIIPLAIVEPLAEHTFRWEYAVRPKWATILASLGKINSKSFAFPDRYFANPETMLFMGVQGERNFLWTGARNAPVRVSAWNLDYKMNHREISVTDPKFNGAPNNTMIFGWNHAWIPEVNGYRELSRDCGSDRLYQSVDFAPLFKSATFLPVDPNP